MSAREAPTPLLPRAQRGRWCPPRPSNSTYTVDLQEQRRVKMIRLGRKGAGYAFFLHIYICLHIVHICFFSCIFVHIVHILHTVHILSHLHMLKLPVGRKQRNKSKQSRSAVTATKSKKHKVAFDPSDGEIVGAEV